MCACYWILINLGELLGIYFQVVKVWRIVIEYYDRLLVFRLNGEKRKGHVAQKLRFRNPKDQRQAYYSNVHLQLLFNLCARLKAESNYNIPSLIRSLLVSCRLRYQLNIQMVTGRAKFMLYLVGQGEFLGIYLWVIKYLEYCQ